MGRLTAIITRPNARLFQNALPRFIALSNRANRSLKENGVDLFKTAFALLLTAFSAVAFHTPQEPLVKSVVELFSILGFFVVFIAPLVRAYIAASSPAVLLNAIIRSVTAYAAILCVIGFAGDFLYQSAIEYPQQSLILAIAVLLTSSLLKHAEPPKIAESSGTMALGVARYATRTKLSPRTVQNVAAHEAGHIILYAGLGALPPETEVRVLDQSSITGARGYVSAMPSCPDAPERTTAEWQMLVYLAGREAESYLLGAENLGSGEDHASWLSAATRYLACFNRGVFYQPPKSQLEQESNNLKLEALRLEQIEQIRAFFALNESILSQIASTLAEKRCLYREDLIPVLSQVKFPANFPYPFGPFDAFSAEWQATHHCEPSNGSEKEIA